MERRWSAHWPHSLRHRLRRRNSPVERGEYLVHIGGCGDCHTPGYFLGKPDEARYLGGSDVGFEIPGLGTFVGPNLTPDEKTGLGTWSKEQIVAAIQTGQTPEGRLLAPVMPWRDFAHLTKWTLGDRELPEEPEADRASSGGPVRA